MYKKEAAKRATKVQTGRAEKAEGKHQQRKESIEPTHLNQALNKSSIDIDVSL